MFKVCNLWCRCDTHIKWSAFMDNLSDTYCNLFRKWCTKNENCTVTISEDEYTWTCPNGHGVVDRGVRHRESHSCKQCDDLDYFK